MRFVNLTRKTVTLYDEEGKNVIAEFPTDPPAADANFTADEVDRFFDEESEEQLRVVRHTFHLVDQLPPREEGIIYIVGWPVIQVMGDRRDDLVAPDTAHESAVRDARGKILGVRQFRVL